MKTVVYTTSAAVDFRRLPDGIRKRLLNKLAAYAKGGVGDVKKLKGQTKLRLRVGDYRILFIETGTTIEVHSVNHRRDAYR